MSFSAEVRRRRWLILGSGAIARRHVECILAVSNSVALSRLSSSGGTPVDPQIDGLMEVVHSTWSEAFAWRPDAAIVANAASAHVDAVKILAHMGVPVLVEKPLSSCAQEALGLANEISGLDSPVLVGYCLRHHRAVKHVLATASSGRLGRLHQCVFHVGQHINDWRSPASRRPVSLRPELGGGALLELSHEIDLALRLNGQPIHVAANVASVKGWQVEATASLLLSYADNSASITLNMLERPARRSLLLVGSDGSLAADLISGTVTAQFGSDEPVQLELPDNGQMYVRQMEHFIGCIEGTETPLVTVSDAAQVVECIALARSTSIESRAQ